MDRYSGHQRGRPVSGLEAAHANEYFEPFLNATTLKNILGYHRSMCEFLHLKPNVFPHFYPKLRANLTSWRAKALWKKFDARASHKCYGKGKICAGTRVLVIGAGPCGLRTAIEAQMLGAKVVVIEKRDRLSRNNVLHLWPFVIEDLRMLGAKKFFGKFCAGAIDHISIRQLQCILLKVALLLGVEVHTEVSFEQVLEPSATEKTGWRAEIKPENHPVSQYEFDVIIGADGKRNTLQGFKRKEFRGKLAIAITANFINKKSEAEARVEEISGVAFIFNQKFFKDLQAETRIDLENIVYYKDDTHYFVMTAKKASLLEKGVIKQDLSDTEKLLAPENVDRDALQNYARQAADFSTNYQLPHLEFAVNHYGQPDVAMFDFTSMYAAEYASKVVERHGSRLLMILVGDSLLEPFWPTGSGCARGFLSSLDAAWAIRSYCSGQMTPLDVLAERESIYRLLAQTTPDNLNKDWKAYTLDPATRYPNLNKSVVTPHQTVCLYDTDNADSIDKMKRASLEAVSRQDHVPKKRRRGNVDNEVLLSWLSEQLRDNPDLTITDISSAFRNGKTLCAIIHHYRPDLLDYSAIKDNDPGKCNQLAMDILERDLGLPPFMTGEEITNTEDYLAMATYLTQVYDTFRGEIPHIKHPKLGLFKSCTKIPKSVPKPVSKFCNTLMSAALFEKVRMIEANDSQTAVVAQNINSVKHKANKAGGDSISVGKEKKCDKLRTFLKEHKVRTRTEGLRLGKSQRQISNDDLAALGNDRKSRIPRKKLLKRHPVEPKPLQTLSEKTFLTASIKSFKSSEGTHKSEQRQIKMKFFDLTYCDNGVLHKKNLETQKLKSDQVLRTFKKASGSNAREDKKVKKNKSRNVSLYVNLCETKPLKKKHLKAKKSKLSVIPENTEDKLSEMAKIANKASSGGLEENSNIEVCVEKAHRVAAHESVAKKPNRGVSFGNSVKLFRCETFVHDSVDSLKLPSIPSLGQAHRPESICFAQAEPKASDLSSKPESYLVDIPAKPKKSNIINKAIMSPRRKAAASKTSLGKLKHGGNIQSNIFGLGGSSPLQIIRKHISMKRQQLSLVLSKPKVPKDKREPEQIKMPTANKKNLMYNIEGKNSSSVRTYNSSTHSINIQVIHRSSSDRITCQNVEYKSSRNLVKITSKGFVPKRQDLSSSVAIIGESTSTSRSPYRNSTVSKLSTSNHPSTVKHKMVKNIFTNASSYVESVGGICSPRLNKPRFPDLRIRRKIKIRKSRSHLGFKKKPPLTPVDEQIINSLGVTDESHLKKTCQQTSHNNRERERKKKFSLQNSLRSAIGKRQKLYGDLRPASKAAKESCSRVSKLSSSLDLKAKKIKMEFYDDSENLSPQMYTRVQKWISQHDFKADEVKKDPEAETLITCDLPSDITSVTRAHIKKKGEYDDIKVEQRTDVIKCESPTQSSQEDFVELVKILKDGKTTHPKDSRICIKPVSKYSQFNMKSVSAPPANFSVIIEGEESELPESNKRSEFSFKSIKTSNHQPSIPNNQPSIPSSRHKRHAEVMVPKPCSIDRKQRKRRTLEPIGPSVEERQRTLEEISANRHDRQSKRKQQRQRQTEQFIKSMQMLQANCKPDCSEPFEDYSIFLYRQTAPKFEDRVKDLEKQFTYVPDYDSRITGLKPLANTNAEEDIASKIKSLEDKWIRQLPTEKKPKYLMRAIGKIETSDWNIKQIEKKILENKIGKPSTLNTDKERVPRWSKEEFRARQTKMEKKHLDRQESTEAKYADIDRNIKQLELKLKEGTNRELGQNKVASITEKLVNKVPQEEKPIEKPLKPVSLPVQTASECCHFCGKRVYLMERVSAEGRFFHHRCFKCQYCHSQLRLGSYMFDRDGQYGYGFFCIHHYGMQGELPRPTKVTRKPSVKGSREAGRSPQKKPLSAVAGVDLLDRVRTPERIEFANLSTDNISDHEEPLSQMDEDEWTDKNFGASCNELDESEDDSSSSVSDTDSDDEDAFDDALEQPITKEGTMKWAERLKNSYRKGHHSDSDGYSSSDHSSYYENSTDDSDSDTATEGEEEIRARELRRQEVQVEPPVVQTDTGTDTEMFSEGSESESSEIHNSATEISTDSEFAQDEPTPTRELPSITLNDFYVTKTRGSGKSNCPKRLQVTSGFIQRHQNEKSKPKPDIELKLSPLVPSTPSFKKPTPVSLARTEGYALNRTQSTGGIAAKVSLELKKKYLLGESGTNSIQKSGSASTLDTKFKSFQTTISDCQKLLKPAPEVSASMQMFCSKLDERHSPILSPQGPFAFTGLKQSPIIESKQPDLPPPDITITTTTENKSEALKDNESDYRPRSPVHETSIPVPSIDWSKQNHSHSSDSLSLSESGSENDDPKTPNFPIPRVEVHAAKESDKEEIALDSLTELAKQECSKSKGPPTTNCESSKSVTTEKKSLNQPKTLPNLESVLPEVHKALHVKLKMDKDDSPEDNKSQKTISGKSSPDLTAALTETELSDWARDENVSDSIELDISQSSEKKKHIKMAGLSEFDEAANQHVCGKDSKELANKTILTEALNSVLNRNLDNIEYMDTGTETSSEDGLVDSQNGYVLLKSEDDLAEDILNPRVNDIFEARNVYLTKKEATPNHNTGYCELVKESPNPFGGEVVDLQPGDVEKLKQKQLLTDHEEDSLLVVETGTTTEENTCSDSTVKNATQICSDNKPSIKIENMQKQRLEEKLAKVKAEQAMLNEQIQKEANEKENVENNVHYEEHCQRLQSKVEFGNARDSIDIRKSRRKSKSDSPQKPDLIQEEKERASTPKDISLKLDPLIRPDVLYKKENIKKERDVNKKLIEEMVMNKMRAENKSLERKKRNRGNMSALSPSRPYNIQKSNTTDIVSQINLSNLDKSSNAYATPDLLSDSIPPVNSNINSSNEIYSTPMTSCTPKQNSNRPLSVFSAFTDVRKLPATPLTNPENFSMPDIRKNLFGDDFKTPQAPPRHNRPSDLAKTAQKMKESARARARLLSNEDLGLSPEDKIYKLREKVNKKPSKDVHVQESIESLVLNTERRNSLLYSNDTLTKKRNNSFRRSKSGDADPINTDGNNGMASSVRPKSISEIPKNLSLTKSTEIDKEGNKKFCMSDPNLLDTSTSKSKKKSKDRERRKSITKLIAGIFTKKSPSGNGSKSLFAKLSPKSKAISKEAVIEEAKPRKSLSEMNMKKREPTPPPIPPLPANYTMKATDESSDGEVTESKFEDRSSCDTVDQSGNPNVSTIGKKTGKARRLSRQAQLKRHRMAQEIQRKLEETEVKTRELEQRGVEIEKALRGEDDGLNTKDESDLLQDWFDLMRDRTELRRYEKELMVRGQELELEDRHSRLQLELRERIECSEHKTEEDLNVEQSIINEMMDIVAKRDALIAVLEADRLRYSHENKDLEEQMLAKGLMLTSIQKSPEK